MKKILFLIMILFVGINLVNADGNTLEDVANKMKETEIYELLDNEEDPLVVKTFPDKLVITSTSKINEEIYKFDFANDIISWRFTGDKNNPDEVFDSFGSSLMIVDIIYAVGLLNGYTEEEMKIWSDPDNDILYENLSLEENGIEITTYSYDFREEGTGGSGTNADSFKIDINKFDVGEIKVPDDTNKDDIFVPTLEVLEVTDTSVKFRVTAEGVKEGKYCYLYRSDTEELNFSGDGNIYITGDECNSVIEDDGLVPGKTYYYRSLVENESDDFSMDAFSKVVKVTTKEKTDNVPSSSENKVDTNGNVVENPKTGANIAVFLIIVLMIFGFIGAINYIRVYSDLK